MNLEIVIKLKKNFNSAQGKRMNLFLVRRQQFLIDKIVQLSILNKDFNSKLKLINV